MKRFWMMLLTISVVLVIALPAGVAKPGKGPKPPKAEPIAVSLYVNPMWVHEDADVLRYTVTLENKTSDTIDGIRVNLSAATPTIEIWAGSIGPNESVAFDGGSRNVSEFPDSGDCLDGEECPLLATAEVLIGVNPLTQVTMSTPLIPYPSCNFNEVSGGVCIWTPPQTGVWKITLAPTPPNNPKRNFTASVSVRDHVPGNWCSLAVDGSWGFGERWRDGDDPIDGEVYLPGVENFLELGLGDGVCLAGGAGGDYFAVGNPDSFYLRTNGDVTVRWDRPLP